MSDISDLKAALIEQGAIALMGVKIGTKYDALESWLSDLLREIDKLPDAQAVYAVISQTACDVIDSPRLPRVAPTLIATALYEVQGILNRIAAEAKARQDHITVITARRASLLKRPGVQGTQGILAGMERELRDLIIAGVPQHPTFELLMLLDAALTELDLQLFRPAGTRRPKQKKPNTSGFIMGVNGKVPSGRW